MWEFWRGKLSRTSSSMGGSEDGAVQSIDGVGRTSRRVLPIVNFKDLNLSVDDELESEDIENAELHQADVGDTLDSTNKSTIIGKRSHLRPARGAQRNKLILVMVGLPGRGKTFLCNKLKCYLNWLGHSTAHFNVGNYRRLQRGQDEVQDASFFDAHNRAGMEARERALHAALTDVMAYLDGDGQVAIFDATNTTNERRQHLRDTFHGKYQYLFIESICNDSQVLEDNYRFKMKYSPDYQGVDTETALADFKARILKYNEVYEPIEDRCLHYIKLIDMVTGRGYMDVNRISGYIPGKIVFFLMQVCKAGMTAGQGRKIWLTRHGESEYNTLAKIGGDSLLSARGEEYARLLPDVLEQRLPATFEETGVPVSVWTSTLRRTIATASYLPYPKLRWKALDEIHAGICDGMTYAEIAKSMPDDYEARKKDKLRYRYPSGESYLDVIQRLEPVIIEMEREKEYVVVVAHQAVHRAIFGYFTATPPKDIPRLSIPLHTLIELQPRPDGTMEVTLIPVTIPTPRNSLGSLGTPPPKLNPNPPIQVPLGSSPITAVTASNYRMPLSSSVPTMATGFMSPLSAGVGSSGLPPSGATAFSTAAVKTLHRRSTSGSGLRHASGALDAGMQDLPLIQTHVDGASVAGSPFSSAMAALESETGESP